MDIIAYAVYILNRRRGYCTLASRPNADRSVTAALAAAQRPGAYIVPGSDFPATLTLEEMTQRTGLAVPGIEPIATD